MNNWLKLALFAFIGIFVSSLALGAMAYVNSSNANMGNMNMGTANSENMNMGTTNSQNMNMGTTNTGSMNMGGVSNQTWPMGRGYEATPWSQGGINPMQYWALNRMNHFNNWGGYPNQYMNIGPGQMPNMYSNPGQMQNMNMNSQGMNMQGNMGSGMMM